MPEDVDELRVPDGIKCRGEVDVEEIEISAGYVCFFNDIQKVRELS